MVLRWRPVRPYGTFAEQELVGTPHHVVTQHVAWE